MGLDPKNCEELEESGLFGLLKSNKRLDVLRLVVASLKIILMYYLTQSWLFYCAFANESPVLIN